MGNETIKVNQSQRTYGILEGTEEYGKVSDMRRIYGEEEKQIYHYRMSRKFWVRLR